MDSQKQTPGVGSDPTPAKPASARMKLAGIASYLAVISPPALTAILLDEELHSNGAVYFALAIAGIIAFTIFSLQFVLAARFSWISRPFGAPSVMKLHKAMAVAATALVFIHVGLLILSRSNWNLLLRPSVGWPIQIGRLAAISLLVTLGYSFGRKWIPLNNADWCFFHSVLAWIVLLSGFVHGIVLGSSFSSPLFTVLWVSYFAIAVLAWISRPKPLASKRR